MPGRVVLCVVLDCLLLAAVSSLLQDAQVILDVKKWLSAQGSKIKVRGCIQLAGACRLLDSDWTVAAAGCCFSMAGVRHVEWHTLLVHTGAGKH
jgi:hypothetical protein